MIEMEIIAGEVVIEQEVLFEGELIDISKELPNLDEVAY